MSTQPDQSKFHLTLRSQSWRVWEGSAVVFEPASGDTHSIDQPGGDILSLLAESDTDHATLLTSLQSIASPQKIDEALELLLALELVERT